MKILPFIILFCLPLNLYSETDNFGCPVINLNEVVVYGKELSEKDSTNIQPQSIVSKEELLSSGQTEIMPTLSQQAAGIFVTSRGVTGCGVSNGSAGDINMRGFSGKNGRILVLIDGHPQYAAIYGHPISDAYMTSDVEQVEISHGASSVLYGSNAMGGAINLISRQQKENGNDFTARFSGGSYGTAKCMLNENFRKDKFHFGITGNYEHTDGHRKNAAFSSASGMAKIGYDFNDNWFLNGSSNLVYFESENPGSTSMPMLDGLAKVTRNSSMISVENKYAKTHGQCNLYCNYGKHKINDGHTALATPQVYLFHSTDYMCGTNLRQSFSLFKGNTITLGFDTKLYGGNAYRNPVTEVYADHIKMYEIAEYLLIQQSFWHFSATGGIRQENHKLYGSILVPEVGLAYDIVKNNKLSFSVSKGFRTPNMRELYMYAVANEDLSPEICWSYDLSYTHKHKSGTFDLNLFYTKGTNIVEVIQLADGRQQNHNAGEFCNKGIETSISEKIIDNLYANLNYSFIGMTKKITGTPTHKFYAGIKYTYKYLHFNVGVQTINKLYLQTSPKEITENYVLLNASISCTPTKWMSLFVQGENLLAQRYQTMLGFPMPKATVMGGIEIHF